VSTSDGPTDAPITQLLEAWQRGDVDAENKLTEAIYDRVRLIAKRAMQQQRGGTISPTEVAHEALLRLLGNQAKIADRRHLFFWVGGATRAILVDAARRRLAIKRGDGAEKLALQDVQDIPIAVDQQLLDLHEGLETLASENERAARCVELVYFAGATHEEAAVVLEISSRTVEYDLRFARAWLRNELNS
jgi:RNA polymerase sigma-70 factor, ECF subfamily